MSSVRIGEHALVIGEHALVAMSKTCYNGSRVCVCICVCGGNVRREGMVKLVCVCVYIST